MDRHGTLDVDDAGVSPVLGVILMVALTVVLASSAHVFLFSYGQGSLVDPPQATFAFETGGCDKAKVTVSHAAGQPIPADRLYLRADGVALSGSWADPSGYSTDGVDDGTVDAGDAASVCADGLQDLEVRVVWVADDGERTVLLAEWSSR